MQDLPEDVQAIPPSDDSTLPKEALEAQVEKVERDDGEVAIAELLGRKRGPGRPRKNEIAFRREKMSPAFAALTLWQFRTMQIKFEYPQYSNTQISRLVDQAVAPISEFLKSDKYKNAVVEYGKQKLFWLVPIAVKALKDILEGPNANAKLNAANKILEDMGILSKDTLTKVLNQINTQINISTLDLKSKSVEELNQMLLDQIRGG